MKKLISMVLALVMCLSLMPCAFAAETVSASDKFTDVSADAWYLDELNYALANGYISGTSTSTFSPSDKITRGQFVTILGRMLGVSVSSGNTKFTDVDETSWYAPYVAWAAQNGYVNGTSSSTFSPESTITCEQMGVIIANYISKSGVALSGYTASPAYKDASSISSWAVSSMELMRQYGLLVTDAAGNVNPQNSVNRAEGTVSLVRLAKAMGLGEAPVVSQNPVAVQKPASAYDDIFAMFIPDEPELISSFKYTDTAAWESNIRYMFKHGLSELEVTIDCTGAGGTDVEDTFFAVAMKYRPLWGSCSVPASATSTTSFQSRTITILRLESGSNISVLQEAIKVHDTLLSSGKITSTMTQKEKARVCYDWILSHCEYDYSYAGESSGAVSVFERGKATCEGYTSAYNMLLMLEGITCEMIESQLGDHAWTAATLDGVLYHIDTTHGDTSGDANKYFCMTPEAAWARFGGYEKEQEYLQSIDDMWDDLWSELGWD